MEMILFGSLIVILILPLISSNFAYGLFEDKDTEKRKMLHKELIDNEKHIEKIKSDIEIIDIEGEKFSYLEDKLSKFLDRENDLIEKINELEQNKVTIKPQVGNTLQVVINWDLEKSVKDRLTCISKTEIVTYHNETRNVLYFTGTDQNLKEGSILFSEIPNLGDAVIPCIGKMKIDLSKTESINPKKFEIFTTFAFFMNPLSYDGEYLNSYYYEANTDYLLVNEAQYLYSESNYWKKSNPCSIGSYGPCRNHIKTTNSNFVIR